MFMGNIEENNLARCARSIGPPLHLIAVVKMAIADVCILLLCKGRMFDIPRREHNHAITLLGAILFSDILHSFMAC